MEISVINLPLVICTFWRFRSAHGYLIEFSLIFSYPTPQMQVALARKADRKFRWANWRDVYIPYPSITRKWACGWGVGASLPVVHPPSGRCRTSSKRCRPQRIVTTFLINPEPANRISVGLFLMRQVWRTCRERNYKTLLYVFWERLLLLMAIRVLFQWEVDSGHGVSSRKGYKLSSWLWLGNYHGKRFTCLKKNEEFGVSMTSGKSKIRTWLFEGADGQEFHKRNWIVMSPKAWKSTLDRNDE